VLCSTEFISPELMGKIYKLFFGMSKDDQRFLLPMSDAAKCWHENQIHLRTDNFFCYSPSYGRQDDDSLSEIGITSTYLNSSRVKRGIKFGCA
jgi:hypothetical protein